MLRFVKRSVFVLTLVAAIFAIQMVGFGQPAAVEVSNHGELVQAINSAVNGDTIKLTQGFDLPQTVTVNKDLNFIADDEVVLTTSSGGRHLLVQGGTITLIFEQVVLDGGEVAGGIQSDAQHLILDADIINCVCPKAYGYGGGVYSRYSLTIVGGHITNNSAINGGGVYVEERNLTITGGAILENQASSTAGGAGGAKNTTIHITGGEIARNHAINGSGVHGKENSTILVSGGLITGNSAQAGGGLMGAHGADITITGGEISNNSAYSGGGVYASGPSNLSVTGGVISGNTATSKGGGVCINLYDGGSAVIEGGYITGNHTDQQGGGIYSITHLSVKGGHISDNTSAREGGGIYIANAIVYGHLKLKIDGGEISGNTASRNGGGIFISDLNDLEIRNDAVVENNKSHQAYYMTDPADVAIHNRNIDPTVTWSRGFEYVYNNHDVVYTKGSTAPPYETHTVTVTTHYTDDAQPDHTDTYQAIPGEPFSESFEVLDGYKLVGDETTPEYSVDMENKLVIVDSVDEDLDIVLEFEPEEGHTVRITTRYRDGALRDHTDTYIVPHGTAFSEPFEVLDNYSLYGSMVMSITYHVDMTNKLVNISSVEQDLDIVLEFYRVGYTVTVVTRYDDDAMPELEQTYNVLHGDPFEESFEMLEGYQVKDIIMDSVGFMVIPGEKLVRVNSVTRNMKVIIVFEKL